MHRGRQVRDRGTYGCSLLWSTPTVIQRPLVDEEQKGVRGGKCGKPTSNSLSFSITRCCLSRQNIQWMLHPRTLPAAAGQCYTYIIAHHPHMPGRADPIDRSLTTLPH